MIYIPLLVDFIEEKNKKGDKIDDEATPMEAKRCPARVSSEKAKKRLK